MGWKSETQSNSLIHSNTCRQNTNIESKQISSVATPKKKSSGSIIFSMRNNKVPQTTAWACLELEYKTWSTTVTSWPKRALAYLHALKHTMTSIIENFWHNNTGSRKTQRFISLSFSLSLSVPLLFAGNIVGLWPFFYSSFFYRFFGVGLPAYLSNPSPFSGITFL